MVALAAPPKSSAAERARVPASLAADPQFHVIDNVPIFPEHTVEAKDGRTLVFDYAALKQVCDNCNRRIVATGDYAGITIGHSPDPDLVRSGEALTPPLVGFAGPFKLGLLGQPGYQKWCILCRCRIFKEDWPAVRKYPRRSPELWLMPTFDQMFLDPIACLGAETPRLDLGLLYSAVVSHGSADHGEVVKYAAAAPAAGNVFVPNERYQGESPMPSLDEIVQAVIQALDGLDWVQDIKQQMAARQAPAAMGSAPAPDVNAPPPPAPELAGNPGESPASPAPPAGAPADAAPAAPAAPAAAPPAAAPAPTAAPDRKDAEVDKNAGMPRTTYAAADDEGDKDDPDKGPQDDSGAPAGTLVDDDQDDDLPVNAGESAEEYRARSRDHRRNRRRKLNYSAQGDAALASIVKQAVDSQLGPAMAQLKNVERLTKLEGLARQGYMIDPSAVMEKLRYSADGKGVSDEEFSRTFDLLLKSGNRVPLDTMLPIPESVEQYSAQPGGSGKVATKEHREATMQLCSAAAEAGQRPDYVGTLHNVVAGKREVVLTK